MKIFEILNYIGNLSSSDENKKDRYDYLEEQEKDLIDKDEYDDWNFEEEELDEDDYYYDDDLGNDEDEDDEEED